MKQDAMYPVARIIFLSLALFFISLNATSSPGTIEQLKANIFSAKNDAEKLKALLLFCDEWDSFSPDTLYKYAKLTNELAVNAKQEDAILQSKYFLAAYQFQQNNLDTALVLANDVFTEYKKMHPYDGMYVKLYRLRGNIYARQAKYDDNAKQDFELLSLAETQKDSFGIAVAFIGLGNNSNKLQKKEDALTWYYKALHVMQNDSIKKKLCFIYNNIAIVQYKMAHEDSMFYYVRKGMQFSQASGNLTDIANSYFLYGGMLAEFGKTDSAELAFKRGLEERKKIGDIYYVVSDMAQFALFYLDTKQPQKGIALCLEAIALAKQNQFYALTDIYQSLVRNYKAAGDYKNAEAASEELMQLKDSIYAKNSADALAEMQTKYDLQKKENTIIEQKYDLAKKNDLIYGSVALLAATLLFGFFYLQNRRKNQQIKLQAVEMEQKKNTAKAVMEAEEHERKRIAGELHDSVAQKMVVAKINLEALRKSLNEISEHENKILSNAQSLLDESTTEVRNLSHIMMPQALILSGLANTVKNFLDKINQPQLNIHFSASGDFATVPENTALMIYRIIQECVQNVIKHASATKLDISMIVENNELDVTIEDNGIGFDTQTAQLSETNGLRNLRSRIAYLNGTLEINSDKGNGTIIVFYIPLLQ